MRSDLIKSLDNYANAYKCNGFGFAHILLFANSAIPEFFGEF